MELGSWEWCCRYSSVLCSSVGTWAVDTGHNSKLHDFQSLEAEILMFQYVRLLLLLGQGPRPQIFWEDRVGRGQHAKMIRSEYCSLWVSWRHTDSASLTNSREEVPVFRSSYKRGEAGLIVKLKALPARSLILFPNAQIMSRPFFGK